MTGIRDGLSGIGEPKKLPIALRADFHNRIPRSLRAAMDGMADPHVGDWREVGVALLSENTALSEEAQGATTDGARWYVCSNNTKQVVAFDDAGNRAAAYAPNVEVFTKMWEDLGAPVFFGSRLLNPHFGAPAYHQGWVHVPVQVPHGVWRFRVDTGQQVWARASALPDGDLFPWCAVHPVTGVLYTSNFGSPQEIRAYEAYGDPIIARRATEDITIETISVQTPIGPISFPTHVQGGVFTPHGRLILVCSDGNAVFCFSGLNGHLFGATRLGDFGSSFSEVESVTLRSWRFGDVSAQVHILELDNDWLSKDDCYLHSYRVPDLVKL
jgi:hypothetical protein